MSRSKSSSSGLVNKWSWSPALVKSIIDFVSWVPCFCFPAFLGHMTFVAQKMFCLSKSFWSTAWCLRLSFVYFLWFWAFTRVTRLEKHLRKPLKMNLVITDFLTEYKNVCEVNVIDVNVDIVKFYSDDQN